MNKIAEFGHSRYKGMYGFNVTVYKKDDGTIIVESGGKLKSTYNSFLDFIEDLINENPLWHTYYYVKVDEMYKLIVQKKLKDTLVYIFDCLNASAINSRNNWILGDTFMGMGNFAYNVMNEQMENSRIHYYIDDIQRKEIEPVKINQIWNGFCPECMLKNKNVKMRLNKNDFYECEESALQICVLSGVQAIIMNFRGKGDFKNEPRYSTDIENGEILSPQNYNGFPFNNPTEIFENTKDIVDYLKNIND